MKNIYVHIIFGVVFPFVLAAYPFTLYADGDGNNQPASIRITGVEASVSGDSLRVNFHIRVQGIDLRTYQRLKLELAVRSDEKQVFLPPIVYSGKTRERYDRRNRQLSPSYDDRGEPYRLYTGIQREEVYELEYKVNTPYARWMDHAALVLRQTFDSNGFSSVDEQVLSEDLYPEHTEGNEE